MVRNQPGKFSAYTIFQIFWEAGKRCVQFSYCSILKYNFDPPSGFNALIIFYFNFILHIQQRKRQ